MTETETGVRRKVGDGARVHWPVAGHDEPWAVGAVGVGGLQLGLEPSELVAERAAEKSGVQSFGGQREVSLAGDGHEGGVRIVERIPHVLGGRVVHVPALAIISEVVQRRVTTHHSS